MYIFIFSVPELLVLNDCDIDEAGEPDDLRQKCRSVKELDLAQNKLQKWNEVFTILSHMPRVEFVNLSLNRLCGPVEPPPPSCDMSRLRSLVLNNTRLDWDSVETIIKLLPVLEELHLSLNDYRNVLIDTLDDYEFDDDGGGSSGSTGTPDDIIMDIDDDDSNSSGACTCGSDGGGSGVRTSSAGGAPPSAAKRSKI